MTSLRYQGKNVSSYDNLENRVTGVSDLYKVSDAQTLSQQWVIHDVVNCWTLSKHLTRSSTLHHVAKILFAVTLAKSFVNPFAYWESRFLLFNSNHNPCENLIIKKKRLIVYNARVYDQLRLQSASVSSYGDIGNWVTDVSVLCFDSVTQTTNQAIGYTRCCKLLDVEQTSDPFFNITQSGKHPFWGDIGKIICKSFCL